MTTTMYDTSPTLCTFPPPGRRGQVPVGRGRVQAAESAGGRLEGDGQHVLARGEGWGVKLFVCRTYYHTTTPTHINTLTHTLPHQHTPTH